MGQTNANEAKDEARVSEWEERARECRSGALSVKAWRAEQGIKPATYYRREHEVLTRADEGMSKGGARPEEAERTSTSVELTKDGINQGDVSRKRSVVAELETGKGFVRIYEGGGSGGRPDAVRGGVMLNDSPARRISALPAAIRTCGGGLTGLRG